MDQIIDHHVLKKKGDLDIFCISKTKAEVIPGSDAVQPARRKLTTISLFDREPAFCAADI